MAVRNSSIEWTDHTWSPLTGCTKVSPGCDNCYAKTMHERFNGPGSFDTVTLHPQRLEQPLHWRKPAKVFVNSMADLFHDDVPDQFIAEVWAVMSLAPQHKFQILTKRHARMRALTGSFLFRIMVNAARMNRGFSVLPDSPPKGPSWPLRNVWLGVSVENQQWADIRIPALLETPAAVRFISAEPLLGPLTFEAELLDWVIVGGESGRGARPMHPGWVRQIRYQCKQVGTPFLFKQWGEWSPVKGAGEWQNRTDRDYEIRFDGYSWPMVQPHGAEDGTEQLIRRVGKKAAGRELDGRLWDEYPVAESVGVS